MADVKKWHQRDRRHPLEVTADRLGDHMEKHYDQMTGTERDEFSHVRFVLQEIAEGKRTAFGDEQN